MLAKSGISFLILPRPKCRCTKYAQQRKSRLSWKERRNILFIEWHLKNYSGENLTDGLWQVCGSWRPAWISIILLMTFHVDTCRLSFRKNLQMNFFMQNIIKPWLIIPVVYLKGLFNKIWGRSKIVPINKYLYYGINHWKCFLHCFCVGQYMGPPQHVE